jgi:acetyl esterase/lipase
MTGRDVIATHGIVYATVPGYRPLALDLYCGQNPQALCVYLHGGGWRMGNRRNAPGPVGPSAVRYFTRMATAGLAVASIDYRLSGEARFPAQLEDLTAAVAFLREHGDEHGVGRLPLTLWGASAGAHLAALGALTTLPDVAAVSCWSAPSELAALAGDLDALGETGDRGSESREALLLGAPPSEVTELAAEASPAVQARSVSTAFLLVHGNADTNVPLAQSERFAAALRVAGTSVKMLTVDGCNHFYSTIAEHRLDALVDDTIQFLLHHRAAA